MGVQRKTGKRKQYTSEFKREAVRLVTEGGLSMAQVARDLGLTDNLVSRWKKEAQQNGQRAFPGQGHPQKAIPKMKKWLDCAVKTRCYAKNAILKKAISIFSAATR